MSPTSLPYRALTALGVRLARFGGAKLQEGHYGRRGAPARLREWSERHRDRRRPLVWFHGASVGEGLQAESVLIELRRLVPDAQYAYTHFSASARSLARRMPADVADFIPYDRPEAVDDALAALSPDLLVFAKLDLWPELATRAARRQVRVALVAATVSPGSGRLRWPARPLLSPGYQAVDAAAAIAREDAERLAALGVPRERIRVLGDPRFDSVIAKVGAVRTDDPLLHFGAGAPTLVGGSTWPRDEAVLLEAYASVRADYPEARLILVPHEPTAEHLVGVERAVSRTAALPAAVRLAAAQGPTPLLLVDRVGVLAALYGAGAMAYVGGGFGRAGLHSVLEPAAWSLPVAFGPRWQESRDARLLLDAGAAVALGASTPAAGDLGRCWREWLSDETGRAAQGRRARQVVESGLGGARRSAEMLAELIASRHPRT